MLFLPVHDIELPPLRPAWKTSARPSRSDSRLLSTERGRILPDGASLRNVGSFRGEKSMSGDAMAVVVGNYGSAQLIAANIAADLGIDPSSSSTARTRVPNEPRVRPEAESGFASRTVANVDLTVVRSA